MIWLKLKCLWKHKQDICMDLNTWQTSLLRKHTDFYHSLHDELKQHTLFWRSRSHECCFSQRIEISLCEVFCGSYCKWHRHKRTHVFCCWFDLQPLYGLLQAKLQLITHAYFEEKDFSQISILKVRISPDRNVLVNVKPPSIHLLSPPLTLQELYDHMNSSLKGSALDGSQVYLGRWNLNFMCLYHCI